MISKGKAALALAVMVLLMSFTLLPSVNAANPPAPVERCRITDKRLAELSGLAADDKRWYAVSDGGNRLQVMVLRPDCSVEKTISHPTDPFDVEDMALGSDGTLWLADTGDNGQKRPHIALHALRPNGKSTLYRLTYPDGPHDAEALLLDHAGNPYIITKEPLLSSSVYRPSKSLTSPGPTPLEKVATIRIRSTDTPGGPVGGIGSVLITGGASHAGGTLFALRTYTDAYVYSAPDRNLLAALNREPLRIPLPHETQGEAIAFTPDGTLLSGSEGLDPIRAIPHAATLVTSTLGATTPPTTNTAEVPNTEQVSAGIASWKIIALVVLGVLAVLGLIGYFRFGR